MKFKRILSILMGDCPNCKTQKYWKFESMSFWLGKKYRCTNCGATARLTEETGPK